MRLMSLTTGAVNSPLSLSLMRSFKRKLIKMMLNDMKRHVNPIVLTKNDVIESKNGVNDNKTAAKINDGYLYFS